MKALPARGMVLLGLAPSVIVALWWLSALQDSDSPAELSATALKLQCLAGLAPIALFAVPLGLAAGYRRSVRALLTAAVLAGPLVVLIWSATDLPVRVPILAELLIVLLAALLPALGTGLRATAARAAIPVAATLGSLLVAVALWLANSAWPGAPT